MTGPAGVFEPGRRGAPECPRCRRRSSPPLGAAGNTGYPSRRGRSRLLFGVRSLCVPSPCSLAGVLPIFSLATAGSGATTSSTWLWPLLASGGAPASLPLWPTVVTTSTGVPVSGVARPLPLDLSMIPGFGSVPPKLIRKILAKEYIDISELLPDSWQIEAEGSCCHSKRPRRTLLTDIHVWTECYATMAAILAAAYPAKAPHFFAYLRTISRASRTFEGSAWASYDMAFRRRAANRGSLDWGFVDAALYNEAFAGRAKQIPRYKYCLADTHSSSECPHAPADPGQSGTPPRNAVRGPGPFGRSPSSEICRLFNSPGGSKCKFPYFRYAHLCAKCRRSHPAAECTDGRRQPTPSPSVTGGGSHGSPPLTAS